MFQKEEGGHVYTRGEVTSLMSYAITRRHVGGILDVNTYRLSQIWKI